MNISEVVHPSRLRAAWKKAKTNGGAPGVDGVTIQAFEIDLETELERLREEVLTGCYQSQAFRNVSIPKENGGQRHLAIPTVRDRIIHGALAAVLRPWMEAEFETNSYAYRPGKSYIDAVAQVERYRDAGLTTVIDADLDSYFDRIPHHEVRLRLATMGMPKALISLIDSCLMQPQRSERNGEPILGYGVELGVGLPQGSPLSPMLSNYYLDPLDEAMQRSDSKMVRYADDFVVLCQSPKVAATVMQQIQSQLSELGLLLNIDKTRVTNFDSGFNFLGVCFIDSLVMPLSQQTERMLSERSGRLISVDNLDELPQVDSCSPEPHWRSQLPPALNSIQAAIVGEPDSLDTENHRQEPMLLNQVSRLRSCYLHRQGSVIHKNGNRLEVRVSGECIQTVPGQTLDLLMLFGGVHMTRGAAAFCLEQSIPVLMMTQSSQFIGMMTSHQPWSAPVTIAQVEANQDSELRLHLARYFIRHKITNSLNLLRRAYRGVANKPKEIDDLKRVIAKLDNAHDLNMLRGFEGIAARYYFSALKPLFDDDWQFQGRNRMPPKDPINALMSYGYTLLFNNLLALSQARSLQAQIGFLHGSGGSQPSLILDLMEPYRSLVVDMLILQGIKAEIFTPDGFEYREGACLMKPQTRKHFIQLFEQRMQTEFVHEALNIRTDLRRIMDIQLLELKQFLILKQGELTPLRLR